MVAKIFSSVILGLDAQLIEVEVDVVNGLPATTIVGLAGTAVQESRERVRLAIKNSGLKYPLAKVSVNLAPAHLPKIGTRYDLPIALGILLSSKQVRLPNEEKALFIGELSLDGSVRAVTGVVATVLAAKKFGFTAVYVPLPNWAEAVLVEGIISYPVSSLNQLTKHFAGERIQIPELPVAFLPSINANAAPEILEIDFKNIAGQEVAKRALEIAAAGGHNVCLTGPPGTGKTMLARAMSGIMPPLSKEESLEVAKIYSVAGSWSGLVTQRPFRAPHHTASYSTVIGGGVSAVPGEITLAHRGVLFLDELPEFSRSVLEALRQPLEEGRITLTRSHYTVNFPSECLLVAAFNPCPCGFNNDGTDRCQCSPLAIVRYKRKLSGPLLDRIDLRIEASRISYKTMTNEAESESSEVVRSRIVEARARQFRRYGTFRTNANMTSAEIKRFCVLDPVAQNLLQSASERYNLSGRGILRIMRVARTIADLAGTEDIANSHLAEATHYRLG